jgi:beta-glucanase (GH16 family)
MKLEDALKMYHIPQEEYYLYFSTIPTNIPDDWSGERVKNPRKCTISYLVAVVLILLISVTVWKIVSKTRQTE